MILTGAFMICKALGATWSWLWLVPTALVDATVFDNFHIIIKDKPK